MHTRGGRLRRGRLDDLSGELVADAVEACLRAGALDAWVAPIQMKKGRPGVVLTAMARPEHDDVARLATVLGRPAKTIWAEAWAAAQRQVDS